MCVNYYIVLHKEKEEDKLQYICQMFVNCGYLADIWPRVGSLDLSNTKACEVLAS
jgi:hypothetical protein